MAGHMSASEAARNKITRVTFNHAVRPLLDLFPGRTSEEIYDIINAYLNAVVTEILKKTSEAIISKPVVFRAFLGIFRYTAQRVQDKYGSAYTADKFQEIISPIFVNLPMKKLQKPGTSWTSLRDYLEKRLQSKLTL